MKNRIRLKELNRNEKIFFIGLLVWIFLQATRFVAIPIIENINAGVESAAWMYPAYLDLFAAVLALPLIIGLIYKPGVLSWVFAIVYLAISIIDHCGNFVTVGLVGPPSIVEEGMNPVLVPAIQTAIDALFVLLLLMPKYRKLSFNIAETEIK